MREKVHRRFPRLEGGIRSGHGIGRPDGTTGAAGPWHVRLRGNRILRLRRHRVGEALAYENQGFAPVAQSTHFDNQPFQRRHHDFVPNPLRLHRRYVVDVALLEEVARRVVVLAADECANRAGGTLLVVRQHDVGQRRQRIHDRHHVAWRQLIFDEPRNRLARPHAVLEPHVVIVEEDAEESRLLALRFGLLLNRVANLTRRLGRGRLRRFFDVDQLEGLHGLRLAVLGDLEVLLSQIADRLTLLVGHDHVDANKVNVGPKDRRFGRGRLRLCRRIRLRRRRLRGRLFGAQSQGQRRRAERSQNDGPEIALHTYSG